MNVKETIEIKLQQALITTELEVINESHMHNVPPGSESHFKINIVSPAFVGQSLLQRHRHINQLLQEELAGPVHALSLHTLTPEEWTARTGKLPESPPCMGGKKAEQARQSIS